MPAENNNNSEEPDIYCLPAGDAYQHYKAHEEWLMIRLLLHGLV
jgi:hypothetical protein